MRQRDTLLAVLAAAVLTLTGCVSVTPSSVERPRAPRPYPAGHHSELPGAPDRLAASVPSHTPEPAVAPDRSPGAGAGTTAGPHPPRPLPMPLPERPVAEIPRIANDLPARHTPRPAGQPRPSVRPGPVRSSSATYDMRILCDASAGIAAPVVTSACRGAYR
ncbi:hypothetical protein ABT354_12930 [Streptomyces sp. NPDC000594]|uniref:hypothetical protein n=1 Tax=Streptomyces sp. NPDC000594 TaxID=3154261 RepID=UPI0033197651